GERHLRHDARLLPGHLSRLLGRGALRGDDVHLDPFLHHRRAVRGGEAVAPRAHLGLCARLRRRALPRAARDHRRGGRHRRRKPLVPNALPRGDGTRLRAHGAREGPRRADRALPPRAEERDDPHPHRRGRARAAPLPREPPHGVVLRHSGARELHHRCDPGPGLRGRAGHGVRRLGALHPGPSPHRSLVHAGRSAREARLMPFLPVILATDALLWLLVAAVGLYAWYCVRRPHLALPWQRVFRTRAAAVCTVVLACYAAIGLADSLHYRPALPGPGASYSPEVHSLLDLGLARLREGRERTYSAPLATRSYAREQVEVDGRMVRAYPRLLHGGAHLEDEAERPRDIAARVGLGLFCASLAAMALGLIVKRLERRRPGYPWRTAGATLL